MFANQPEQDLLITVVKMLIKIQSTASFVPNDREKLEEALYNYEKWIAKEAEKESKRKKTE